MSSRSLPIHLSPRARQDFIDILRFTGETFGPNQLQAYRDKIDDALKAIGRNPEFGRLENELQASLRLVGAHVIVYRIEPARIGVVRILHQRMQLSRHIP